MGDRNKYNDEARRFFDSEYPGLYRYALYLTRHPETAEEICQEAFLRWYRLPRPQEIERPRAWLHTVGANLAYNHLRQRSRRQQLEMMEPVENLALASPSDTAHLEVDDILGRMAWRDQMLIKLRIAGLSYQEIAEVMDLSTGSVGTMLARALKRFKDAYQGKEAGSRDEMSR
ncbi:MAG: sigma-70 family RNA polymerase sigma factor, partial [Methanomassiliicoccales archaeon]